MFVLKRVCLRAACRTWEPCTRCQGAPATSTAPGGLVLAICGSPDVSPSDGAENPGLPHRQGLGASRQNAHLSPLYFRLGVLKSFHKAAFFFFLNCFIFIC